MTSQDKIRLLIVDDSFFMRKLIREILQDVNEIEIVGEAKDGIEALKLVFSLEPDVITMDYNMPEMDGEQATIKILHSSKNPPAIIMLSASTKEGTEITIKCLRAGAIDFIAKPSGEVSLDLELVKNELVEKIKVAALARIQSKIDSLKETASELEKGGKKRNEQFVKAIVIGSSTGGPPMVEDILSELPGNLAVPVFVVQHMPPDFTASFAERLDKYSAVRVKEASEGDVIVDGQCYLAKGGLHMEIISKNNDYGIPAIHLTHDEKQSGYRPSINVTMKSVVKIYKEGTLGIVLTGMGEDGALGMKAIKAAGGHTIVQSPETAVIDSMPKAVVGIGSADEILGIDDIIKRINQLTPVK